MPDAESTAESVLARSEHRGPPTDLNEVCSLWPNLSLIEEDLDREGYLVPLGTGGADLLVRRRDPLPRKRFTIAHELGHWVLMANTDSDTDSATETSIGVHKRNTPEETWCNRFAGALLVPRADILEFLRPGRSNVAARIISGGRRFGVSDETLFRRAAEIAQVSTVEVVGTPNRVKTRRIFCAKEIDPQEAEKYAKVVFERGDGPRSRRTSVPETDYRADFILKSSSEQLVVAYVCLYKSATGAGVLA